MAELTRSWTGRVRVTLKDGRVGYGNEGELFDRMFATEENLTAADVARMESQDTDAKWHEVSFG